MTRPLPFLGKALRYLPERNHAALLTFLVRRRGLRDHRSDNRRFLCHKSYVVSRLSFRLGFLRVVVSEGTFNRQETKEHASWETRAAKRHSTDLAPSVEIFKAS